MNTARQTVSSAIYDKVATSASVVRLAALCSIGVLIAISAYQLLAPMHLREFGWLRLQLGVTQIGIAHLQLAGVLMLVPRVLMLYALWRLVQLTRDCEAGNLFLPSAPRHLLAFSLTTFCAQLLQLLTPLSMFGVLRIAGIDWDQPLEIVLDGSDAWGLFLSGIFVLVSWMFKAAQHYAEDSREVI